jgi:hypothetical protein
VVILLYDSLVDLNNKARSDQSEWAFLVIRLCGLFQQIFPAYQIADYLIQLVGGHTFLFHAVAMTDGNGVIF